MSTLTVSSSLLSPTSNQNISPAMLAILWVIGDELDRKRIAHDATDAIWLEIPSRTLRGENARDDNIWLRTHLKRLTGIQIEGEYKNDHWGAVVLAEWHITQGGQMVRLLIPPAAIKAIRAPKTFAKIEAYAAHSMSGTARRLYAVLADKKRMGNSYWDFTMDEIRRALDLNHKYPRWADLRRYALLPAIKEINDYGTVKITMSNKKQGRKIIGVRFDWDWKNLDEIQETQAENDQPKAARHMDRKQSDAPPLIKEKEEKISVYQEKKKADKLQETAHDLMVEYETKFAKHIRQKRDELPSAERQKMDADFLSEWDKKTDDILGIAREFKANGLTKSVALEYGQKLREHHPKTYFSPVDYATQKGASASVIGTLFLMSEKQP